MPYGMTPHGLNTDAFYTTLWNILDCPALCFPTTSVNTDEDVHALPSREFYNHEDQAIHKLYGNKLFRDAPIGLQLVGRSMEEEAVIAMTEVVEMALEKYVEKTGCNVY